MSLRPKMSALEKEARPANYPAFRHGRLPPRPLRTRFLSGLSLCCHPSVIDFAPFASILSDSLCRVSALSSSSLPSRSPPPPPPPPVLRSGPGGDPGREQKHDVWASPRRAASRSPVFVHKRKSFLLRDSARKKGYSVQRTGVLRVICENLLEDLSFAVNMRWDGDRFVVEVPPRDDGWRRVIMNGFLCFAP